MGRIIYYLPDGRMMENGELYANKREHEHAKPFVVPECPEERGEIVDGESQEIRRIGTSAQDAPLLEVLPRLDGREP